MESRVPLVDPDALAVLPAIKFTTSCTLADTFILEFHGATSVKTDSQNFQKVITLQDKPIRFGKHQFTGDVIVALPVPMSRQNALAKVQAIIKTGGGNPYALRAVRPLDLYDAERLAWVDPYKRPVGVTVNFEEAEAAAATAATAAAAAADEADAEDMPPLALVGLSPDIKDVICNGAYELMVIGVPAAKDTLEEAQDAVEEAEAILLKIIDSETPLTFGIWSEMLWDRQTERLRESVQKKSAVSWLDGESPEHISVHVLPKMSSSRRLQWMFFRMRSGSVEPDKTAAFFPTFVSYLCDMGNVDGDQNRLTAARALWRRWGGEPIPHINKMKEARIVIRAANGLEVLRCKICTRPNCSSILCRRWLCTVCNGTLDLRSGNSDRIRRCKLNAIKREEYNALRDAIQGAEILEELGDKWREKLCLEKEAAIARNCCPGGRAKFMVLGTLCLQCRADLVGWTNVGQAFSARASLSELKFRLRKAQAVEIPLGKTEKFCPACTAAEEAEGAERDAIAETAARERSRSPRRTQAQ